MTAAYDDRERHFAATPAEVLAQWADGLADADISRIIVVGPAEQIPDPVRLDGIGAEYTVIDTTGKNLELVAAEVAAAEDASALGS